MYIFVTYEQNMVIHGDSGMVHYYSIIITVIFTYFYYYYHYEYY